MRPPSVRSRVLNAVRQSLSSSSGGLVLAVSGGCDSMVLLHAVHAAAPGRVQTVATFDHGTGPAAREATRLVEREAAHLGFPVVVGRSTSAAKSEAAWRQGRWAFLNRVAAEADARVVTAHTHDDHLETVLMRVLRGSGARGLAGLHAESAVLRPLLSLDRGTIRAYAAEARVAFADDPTNESRRYLRNRIRLDLLPAMRAVHPGIENELLEISRGAAEVRAALDAEARQTSEVLNGGGVAVAARRLEGYSREALAAIWPALAARAGVALDRRGTERVAAFTIEGKPGGRVQVSGGWELHRTVDRFELRRTVESQAQSRRLDGEGMVRFGAWRFMPAAARGDDPWTAALPSRTALVVRPWRPGDRMVAAGSEKPRRVKRFLSDARIAGPYRASWPVVESGGEVVWIPGVRRSAAATVPTGRPAVSYECEFDDRS